MEEKTIFCYGDSNTNGFDPRSFLGGRYEADSRWCDLLAEHTGHKVINAGEDGRMIPRGQWDFDELRWAMQDSRPDLILVMLGTNDILCGASYETAAERMEALLRFFHRGWADIPLVLLGVPPVRIPDDTLCQEVERLNLRYARLAEQRGLVFCDVSGWGFSLACDGVHLSEEDHRRFAVRLEDFLREQDLL